MPFYLKECWNFHFFFIICLNFLDIKATSSSLDPLKLLYEPLDSAICTFRVLEEFFFSSYLELTSLVLRVVESLLGRWFQFWRWNSWTLRIPNSSSHAILFKFLASWMAIAFGYHTLGKLSRILKFIWALVKVCPRTSRPLRSTWSLPNMSSADSPSFTEKLSWCHIKVTSFLSWSSSIPS